MGHDPKIGVDQGQALAGPRGEGDGSRVRVRTARFATPWLPDTPSHRPLTLVWRPFLVDAQGKPMFTLQE